MNPPSNPPSNKDTQALRASLQASLDQAEWAWLERHAQRDAVILVSPELPLVEAGVHIAQDNKALVEEWISSGWLRKPTRAQLDTWKDEPGKRFMVLVVQPYVLVQELVN